MNFMSKSMDYAEGWRNMDYAVKRGDWKVYCAKRRLVKRGVLETSIDEK